MKARWVVLAALCLTTTFVWAQPGANLSGFAGISARSQGMGAIGIGVCDDAMAWAQNPAGLPRLDLTPREGSRWANDAIGLWNRADFGPNTINTWGASWSGFDPSRLQGWGAGFGSMEDVGKGGGLGYGLALRNSPFSFGANAVWCDPDEDDEDSDLLFDLGALYDLRRPMDRLRIGLIATDVTGRRDLGTAFSGGVAWWPSKEWLLGIDVLDITNKTDEGPFYNLGAEYAPGSAPEWRLRAGLEDSGDGHDLTLGAGYRFDRWRLDLGWRNADAGNTWAFSVGSNF